MERTVGEPAVFVFIPGPNTAAKEEEQSLKNIDLGAALAGHLQQASENEEVDPSLNVLLGPSRRQYGEGPQAVKKTALDDSPNFVRIVEAYEGYTQKSLSEQQCLAKLREVTKQLGPGLRLYGLPAVQNKIAAMSEAEQAMASKTVEYTTEIFDSVEGMLVAISTANLKELKAHYKIAVAAFEDLDALQDDANLAAQENRSRAQEEAEQSAAEAGEHSE